jgi:ABC-type cobalamin transport system ATPase subunit
MNSENAIAKLCAAGMKAELAGRPGEAKIYFMQAWASAANDYESCIAAHYVARHQETASEMLRWNQLALDHASKVQDESVNEFYASLYLIDACVTSRHNLRLDA